MFLAITTTGKVVLLIVAGTFIAFALVSAIVIPRRWPGFPGDRLGAFLALVAAVFLAQMGAVVWVAETQESEEHGTEAAETQPAEPGQTGPAETEPAQTGTQPAETETEPAETGGATTGAAQGGDAAAGKQVFESAGCVSCHTLAAAGSSGTIGPNLDDAKPSFDLVVERVTNGKGAMPSFKDQLSEQQIRDVAAFVSESTRG